jgi:hypothetical protein
MSNISSRQLDAHDQLLPPVSVGRIEWPIFELLEPRELLKIENFQGKSNGHGDRCCESSLVKRAATIDDLSFTMVTDFGDTTAQFLWDLLLQCLIYKVTLSLSEEVSLMRKYEA